MMSQFIDKVRKYSHDCKAIRWRLEIEANVHRYQSIAELCFDSIPLRFKESIYLSSDRASTPRHLEY
jgi:hypothetical protein